jgi:hypothetical protein
MPDDSQRTLIIGRTGGGKSMEAAHHLSQRSIDTMPWVIIDTKGDDVMARLPITAPRRLEDGPPPVDEPGLYVVHAEVEDQGRGGPLTDFLTAVYHQGNTGIVLDEAAILGQQNRALRLLLTMGRSKKCPLIMCSQRPVYIDKYAMTESEFIQVFYIQYKQDQKTVHECVPENLLDFEHLQNLPLYHSAYYDVRRNSVSYLPPCPDFQSIYDTILSRLPVYVDPAFPDAEQRVRL